ncbi:MAG: chemotaxis protein CheW [Armatimonadota bacterium]|nr:chemotaxis protein CheW [bacterium]
MSDNMQDSTVDQWEQLVVFELGNEYYGVDIAAVNTIIRMQDVTAIPRAPSFVEGVINLRGSIIPVIDLRKRFGLPVTEQSKASRIVVVEAGGQLIGMIVDAVAETLRLPSHSIEPPSPVISSVDSEYLRGVGKQDNRLVILLDLDKILSAKDFDSMAKVERRAKQSAEEPAKVAA